MINSEDFNKLRTALQRHLLFLLNRPSSARVHHYIHHLPATVHLGLSNGPQAPLFLLIVFQIPLMLGTLLSTKKKGRKKENSFICYLFSWVDLGLDLKWPNWLVLGKERRQALLFLSPMSIFCSASYASPHDSSSDPLMEQETDLDISLKCRKFLSSILVVSLGRGLWSCLPAAFLSLYLNYWVIFFPAEILGDWVLWCH